MRRKVLLVLTALVGGVGMLAVMGFFSGSLAVSDKAKYSRPEIDITNLEDGDFLISKIVKSDQFQDSNILIIRDWNGALYTHLLPIKTSLVVMPDIYWIDNGHYCKDVSPEVVDGKLKKDGVVKCNDANVSKWYTENWEWKYSGEAVQKPMSALITIKHELRGNSILLNL